MKPDANADQLRRIFAERRQREQGPVPAFERVWATAAARAGRRPSRVRLALAATSAAVAVVVAVILLQRPGGSDFTAATQLAAWRSPTAVLLRVPGDDILRVVPSIGAPLMRFETLQPTTDTPRSEECHEVDRDAHARRPGAGRDGSCRRAATVA